MSILGTKVDESGTVSLKYKNESHGLCTIINVLSNIFGKRTANIIGIV